MTFFQIFLQFLRGFQDTSNPRKNLYAYYRVPRVTQGFPILFIGEKFAVYYCDKNYGIKLCQMFISNQQQHWGPPALI